MNAPVLAVTAAAFLAAGYAIGRHQLGDHLLAWAEDATKPGWRTWKFWPGAPIVIVALVWMWVVHPQRTLANVRSWRAEHPRTPAPERRRIGPEV